MPTRVSVAKDTDYELLTADDFLAWLEPGKHADLIDGEVETHAPVSLKHAELLNFVDAILRQYIDRHDLGTLFREVVAVRLSSRNVFMPDLAFYRAGREADLRDTYAAGAAATIHSETVPGFFVRREWLTPAAVPKIDAALTEIEAAR